MTGQEAVTAACGAFALAWESKYSGERYRVTSRDRKEARLTLAGTDAPISEVVSRARTFLAEPFWNTLKHPGWAFFRNYKTYLPKPEAKPHDFTLLVMCSGCGKTHSPNESCRTEDYITFNKMEEARRGSP
jgi:hypothetical protein